MTHEGSGSGGDLPHPEMHDLVHGRQLVPDTEPGLGNQTILIGSTASGQRAVLPTGSPLPDGSAIMDGYVSREWPSYTIANDGVRITVAPAGLLENMGDISVPGYSEQGPVTPFLATVEYMTRMWPRTGELFEFTAQGDHATACTIPTPPALYEFQQRTLSELPTADIQPIQTGYPGAAPAPVFMEHLEDRELVVSLGWRTYLENIATRWLGAATLHERDFAAFLSLYEARGELISGHPGLERSFTESLAKAFTVSTSQVLDYETASQEAHRPGPEHAREYLLATSLREVANRCPYQIVVRCLQKLVTLDLGMTTKVSSPRTLTTSFIVPWEAETLPAHYEAVAAQLG